MAAKSKKQWGGRFRKEQDRLALLYTESVSFDWRLYPYDIAGSIAHTKMLAKQGIISKPEAEAIVGGLTGIHQFVRIGAHSYVGGACRVSKDVPPFFKIGGVPTRPIEVNTVGLLRRGFPEDTLNRLRQCYRLLYLSDLNTTQTLRRVRKVVPSTPETEDLLEFIEQSQRGIIK